ncbi:MAG: 16S rRNA (cytosine(1402)-N(4))-methyltransferase RsmH [Kiritimatiellia bacterium]|nr:16S rRNA (cytosine(1402)-N(4))-methyltransferase RsmH [Kiritimatiellia bacterium]
MSFEKHIPVLLLEAVDALAVKPGGRYVDGTLGRAGHTREILVRGGSVLGIDRDDQALREVEELKSRGDEKWSRLTLARGNHGDLKEIACEKGWTEVDGILLDLGVSSPQLDEAGRGFSFLRDGPLDMRMDRSRGVTAADLVNNESAERLEEIFREWGEEPQARRIARAIVAERKEHSFTTTMELADYLERILGRRGAHHPATRVFQALRMEVNDEMGELERALEGGFRLLRKGGRFAVITFESLTDRVVKRTFAAHVGRMVSLQQGGERWEGDLPRAKAISRKAIVAGAEETALNPRSRSAKLRVIEMEEEDYGKKP